MGLSPFNSILFINSPKNDFLADGFLIGLKSLYGTKVQEWPINSYIYKSNSISVNTMHGIGFTLYNSINADQAVAYTHSKPISEFDLVIFGDIYRQSDLFKTLLPQLKRKSTLILDGEDSSAIWPYYVAPWKKPYSFFYPKPHRYFMYFKRELIPAKTQYYNYYKLIPKPLAAYIPLHSHIAPISFSIPQSKCLIIPPKQKSKTFAKHIVDPEVCQRVPGSSLHYAFTNEADYYNDLQQSKFGISTRRGGWDCLRHYEIAANGAVICFKNLHQKDALCAPHGLKSEFNCIAYTHYNHLMERINTLSDEAYLNLQKHSMEWVQSQTCEKMVLQTLNRFCNSV